MRIPPEQCVSKLFNLQHLFMAKLLIIDPLDLRLEGEDGVVVWSSRECFERELKELEGLSYEIVNATDSDICRKALASDGVLLGGSEESAWEDTAFNDHLLDLIAICRNNEIPLLAICYGAQLLGRALGGHVARHPDGIELGAPAIRLSAKGKKHFLFKGVGGGCIWSVETHGDAVLTMPPDCELLASTEHSPVQAFSYQDLLSGVQFHPEMNGDDLRSLWAAFVQVKIVDEIPEAYSEIIAACECDTVSQVIRNFAERVKTQVVIA